MIPAPEISSNASKSAGRNNSRSSIGALALLSGGIDSCTALMLAQRLQLEVTGLFVDYGQPSARAEECAASSLSDQLGFKLRKVRYQGRAFGAGEIRGRNSFLLNVGLLEVNSEPGIILIGVHAGTNYKDCSPAFLTIMQRSFDFHTGGTISIAAPFASMTKREIFTLATELAVPIFKTYSCEAANQPCQKCNSCLDRQLLTEVASSNC